MFTTTTETTTSTTSLTTTTVSTTIVTTTTTTLTEAPTTTTKAPTTTTTEGTTTEVTTTEVTTTEVTTTEATTTEVTTTEATTTEVTTTEVTTTEATTTEATTFVAETTEVETTVAETTSLSPGLSNFRKKRSSRSDGYVVDFITTIQSALAPKTVTQMYNANLKELETSDALPYPLPKEIFDGESGVNVDVRIDDIVTTESLDDVEIGLISGFSVAGAILIGLTVSAFASSIAKGFLLLFGILCFGKFFTSKFHNKTAMNSYI